MNAEQTATVETLPSFRPIVQPVRAFQIKRGALRFAKDLTDWPIDRDDIGDWMIYLNVRGNLETWKRLSDDQFHADYEPVPPTKEEAFLAHCQRHDIPEGAASAAIRKSRGETLGGWYVGLSSIIVAWEAFSAGYDAATGKVGS